MGTPPRLGALLKTPLSIQESPFPNFDKVQPEHVVPGITALLASLSQEIDSLEKDVTPTWEGLINPLERISDRLSRAWGTISHLKAVKDTEELRKAYEEVRTAGTVQSGEGIRTGHQTNYVQATRSQWCSMEHQRPQPIE